MKQQSVQFVMDQLLEQPALILNVVKDILELKVEDIKDPEECAATLFVAIRLQPTLYFYVQPIIEYLKRKLVDCIYLYLINSQFASVNALEYNQKLYEYDEFDLVLKESIKWKHQTPCTLESLSRVVDVPESIIKSPTVSQNIDMILNQLFCFPIKPLLLVGKNCGTSTILKFIYSIFKRDYVPLFVAHDADLKDLIGFYMCTDNGIEYINGPISTAAKNGEWLSVKLHNVHEDIQQYLAKTLIFNKVENNDKSIYSHPNYRVIGTIDKEPKSHAWHTVNLHQIPDEEWIVIFSHKYKVQGLRYIYDCYLELNINKQILDAWLQRIVDVNCVNWKLESDRIQMAKIGLRLTTRLPNTIGILSKHFLVNSSQLHANAITPPVITRDELKIEHYSIKRSVNTVDTYNLAWIPSSSNLASDSIAALFHNQPLLLIGGTGIGKTATVSEIARILGVNMTILNFSPSTERQDIIGSWKPSKHVGNIHKMHHILNFLSGDTSLLEHCFYKQACDGNPDGYLALINKIIDMLSTQLHSNKRFKSKLDPLSIINQLKDCLKSQIAMTFQIGPLLTAYQNGHVLFLDEINLANSQVLSSISDVIQSPLIKLPEYPVIRKHDNFRILAAMNPATDFGKKELPNQLSDLFIHVSVMDPHDTHSIAILCKELLNHIVHVRLDLLIDTVSKLFHTIITEANTIWLNGNDLRPIFSIRSLKRALNLTNHLLSLGWGIDASLLYGFDMAFTVSLNRESKVKCQSLINDAQLLLFKKPLPKYKFQTFCEKLQLSLNPSAYPFTSTKTLNEHLVVIMKGITSDIPVLLEGVTSSGKTTLIKYIAHVTNNRLIRINNHEHTDLIEYVGNYTLVDNDFVFKYGPLVEAMKNGYWVLLDELNLAPSEILESLNRLLDDNKQLVIPQTNETVIPHPNFRLFATQNPAHLYGGRKQLSNAFRNRFIEIFVGQFDNDDLVLLLQGTHSIPSSWIKKLTMFYSSYGQLTLRDLFKWCKRKATTFDEFVMNGLQLLLEKCRTEQSKSKLFNLFKQCFQFKFTINDYDQSLLCNTSLLMKQFPQYAWNPFFVKSFNLINACVLNKEPVLLISEPGLGKSLLVSILSEYNNNTLHTINCQQETDVSDLLGCYMPVYTDDGGTKMDFKYVNGPVPTAMINGQYLLIDEINLADDAVLERLNSVLEQDGYLLLSDNLQDNSAIKCSSGFNCFATMNPNTDIAKRELSSALRNRFTEIFIHYRLSLDDLIDYSYVYLKSLNINLSEDHVSKACSFYHDIQSKHVSGTFTVRNLQYSLLLINEFGLIPLVYTVSYGLSDSDLLMFDKESNILKVGFKSFDLSPYTGWIKSPSSLFNLQLLLIATSINNPIIIQGTVGIGKSTLVEYCAAINNIKCTKITMSHDLDLCDLFGKYHLIDSKLEFVNGPLLDAVIHGYYVILDELNLANQSVLEGLNSLLDFRRTVVVNSVTYKCHQKFKLIATMNPTCLLDGRKQLPRSFLGRFLLINFKPYNLQDLLIISDSLQIDSSVVHCFNDLNAASDLQLIKVVTPYKQWNIRDLFKYKQLMSAAKHTSKYSAIYALTVDRVDSKNLDAVVDIIGKYFSSVDTPHTRNLSSVINAHSGTTNMLILSNSLKSFYALKKYNIYNCSYFTDVDDLISCTSLVNNSLVYGYSNFIKDIQLPGHSILLSINQCNNSVFDFVNQLFDSDSIYVNNSIIKKHSDHMITLISHDHSYSKALNNRCLIVDCTSTNISGALFVDSDLLLFILLHYRWSNLLKHITMAAKNNNLSLIALISPLYSSISDYPLDTMNYIYKNYITLPAPVKLDLVDYYKSYMRYNQCLRCSNAHDALFNNLVLCLFYTSSSIDFNGHLVSQITHYYNTLHFGTFNNYMDARAMLQRFLDAVNSTAAPETSRDCDTAEIKDDEAAVFKMYSEVDPATVINNYIRFKSTINLFISDFPSILKDARTLLDSNFNFDILFKLLDSLSSISNNILFDSVNVPVFDLFYFNKMQITSKDIKIEYIKQVVLDRPDIAALFLKDILPVVPATRASTEIEELEALAVDTSCSHAFKLLQLEDGLDVTKTDDDMDNVDRSTIPFNLNPSLAINLVLLSLLKNSKYPKVHALLNRMMYNTHQSHFNALIANCVDGSITAATVTSIVNKLAISTPSDPIYQLDLVPLQLLSEIMSVVSELINTCNSLLNNVTDQSTLLYIVQLMNEFVNTPIHKLTMHNTSRLLMQTTTELELMKTTSNRNTVLATACSTLAGYITSIRKLQLSYITNTLILIELKVITAYNNEYVNMIINNNLDAKHYIQYILRLQLPLFILPIIARILHEHGTSTSIFFKTFYNWIHSNYSSSTLVNNMTSKLNDIATINAYKHKNTLYIKDVNDRLQVQVNKVGVEYYNKLASNTVDVTKIELQRLNEREHDLTEQEMEMLSWFPINSKITSLMRSCKYFKNVKSEYCMYSYISAQTIQTGDRAELRCVLFIHYLQFKVYYKQQHYMGDLKKIGQCIMGIYHYLMRTSTTMAFTRLAMNQLLTFVEYLKKQQEQQEQEQEQEQGQQQDSNGLIDATNDVTEQEDLDDVNGDIKDSNNNNNDNDDIVDYMDDVSDLEEIDTDIDTDVGEEMDDVKDDNERLNDDIRDDQDQKEDQLSECSEKEQVDAEDVEMDFQEPQKDVEMGEQLNDKTDEQDMHSQHSELSEHSGLSEHSALSENSAKDVEDAEQVEEVEELEDFDEVEEQPIENEIDDQKIENEIDEPVQVETTKTLEDEIVMDAQNEAESGNADSKAIEDYKNDNPVEMELKNIEDSNPNDGNDDANDDANDINDNMNDEMIMGNSLDCSAVNSSKIDNSTVYNSITTSIPSLNTPITELMRIAIECNQESMLLSRELEHILEYKSKSRLVGDYSSGKRINIRRIMNFMQGNPKIWKRRVKQNKEQCHVMLSIDNSSSMQQVYKQAIYSVMMLCQSIMNHGQLGQVKINLFDTACTTLMDWKGQCELSVLCHFIEKIEFNGEQTDVCKMLSSVEFGKIENKLHIIISDGIYNEHSKIKRLLVEQQEQGVKTLLLIMDRNEFIEELTTATQVQGKIELKKYLDLMAFKYEIVKEVKELPGIIAKALKAYME